MQNEKGKKIMITGAGGFIGAYFLERLKDDNCIIALVRKPPAEYWRLGLFERNYRIERVDVSDRKKIYSVVEHEKPDLLLHFAAYGAYPKTQKDRNEIINGNVIGSMNVIEAGLAYVDTTIIIGSSSEYGSAPAPMRENGTTFPTILYGATKLFAAHYARIRAREEGKKLINLRPFSIYGPYEEPSHLVPYMLCCATFGKELLLSSPQNVRDYIFVEDFFNCVMMLARNAEKEKYSAGETFNIGSGRETTIKELLEIMESKVFGKKLAVKWGRTCAQPEILHWYADVQKISNEGFVPKYNLESGLKMTMEWIQKNIEYYEGATDEH